MGIFYATVAVGNSNGGDQLSVDALVDTGASDSMFPASMLENLRLAPTRSVEYTLADGSKETFGRGEASLTIEGRIGTCPVIFGPEGDDNCLIGATTLQILMLVVDAAEEQLLPTDKGRLGWAGRL